MVKIVGIVVVILAAALWITNSLSTQQQLGQQLPTVQANMTAIARPTPTPTP